MQTINIQDSDAANTIIASLDGDGVVVLPTDTLYGFSAELSSEDAYRRIASIKGSDGARHFVHLAASVEMVANYVEGWNGGIAGSLGAIWPARLTAVLPSGTLVPEWVGTTIAFRVPDVPELCRIIETLGQPIISTSVNRAGERPAVSADQIEDKFADDVDLIVTGEVDTRSKPSTIVTFVEQRPRVLRAGAYAWPAAAKPSN